MDEDEILINEKVASHLGMVNYYKLFPFTRFSSSAELVIDNILSRGWMVIRIDYRSKNPLPAYPNQHRAQILTRDDSNGKWEYWGCDDENANLALCLAFLTACDGEEDSDVSK